MPNQPREFRAVTRIHLGKLERYIDEGSIVSYDGRTLTVDGERVAFSPKQFEAGLKARWFVPAEDRTTTYQPQPSGATIGPAQRADQNERVQRMQVTTVEEDTRVVGSRQEFADHSAEMLASGGKRKMAVIRGEGVDPKTGLPLETQEGEVIGKLRPAVTTTDVSSTDYHAELRRNNALLGAPIEKVVERHVKVAFTGDVTEARSGSDLADLFSQTEAAVGHQPPAGPAGHGPDIHDGLSRVERLKAELAAAEAEEAAAAARAAAAAEARRQERLAQVRAAEVEENHDFLVSDEVEVTSQVVLDAKFAAARSFLPDFQWDMTVHWKTRVANALKADSTTRMAIMAVETDTVKRHILAADE